MFRRLVAINPFKSILPVPQRSLSTVTSLNSSQPYSKRKQNSLQTQIKKLESKELAAEIKQNTVYFNLRKIQDELASKKNQLKEMNEFSPRQYDKSIHDLCKRVYWALLSDGQLNLTYERNDNTKRHLIEMLTPFQDARNEQNYTLPKDFKTFRKQLETLPHEKWQKEFHQVLKHTYADAHKIIQSDYDLLVKNLYEKINDNAPQAHFLYKNSEAGFKKFLEFMKDKPARVNIIKTTEESIIDADHYYHEHNTTGFVHKFITAQFVQEKKLENTVSPRRP